MSYSQIFNLLASKKTGSRFLACNTLPPEFLARNKKPSKNGQYANWNVKRQCKVQLQSCIRVSEVFWLLSAFVE